MVSNESQLTSYTPCCRKHAMFHRGRMVRKMLVLCLCLCDIQFNFKSTRHEVSHTIVYRLVWITQMITNGAIYQQFLRVKYSLLKSLGNKWWTLPPPAIAVCSGAFGCDIFTPCNHTWWRRFLGLVRALSCLREVNHHSLIIRSDSPRYHGRTVKKSHENTICRGDYIIMPTQKKQTKAIMRQLEHIAQLLTAAHSLL